jgi:hypothetical protein
MKKSFQYRFSFVIILIIHAAFFLGWGTFGHERINHAAVLCLPDSLRTFFYNHIDFITQESTVPDLRKYTLEDQIEYPRHYIDLDLYKDREGFPKTLAEANKKYGEDFLAKNGCLPWYIDQVMVKLTRAFREKRKTEILFLAGDLGHYIGDAHMPLHTTSNHDGQFTDQKGIHAFWESQLPELFGETYFYRSAEAKYIRNISLETWSMLFKSYSLVDTLLLTEKRVREKVSADAIYLKTASGEIQRNKFNQMVHTREYSKLYHDALHGMVEKQLRQAISMTASYWYTAWVDAGRPDLSELDPPETTLRNEKQLREELKLLEKGKLRALNSEPEFR